MECLRKCFHYLNDSFGENSDNKDFKYKELTEKIIEIFYRVYNEPGYDLLEKVYENAMMIEFKKENIYAVSQSAIKVLCEGEIVDEYFADILISDKIILKIKAAKNVAEEHESQLLNYLKQLIEKLVFYLIMALYQTLNKKHLIIQENEHLCSRQRCVGQAYAKSVSGIKDYTEKEY